MNPAPNHQELQEMLAAAALETLEAPELQRVMAHVRSCPECSPLLEEYRAAAAGLALTLPPQAMDPSRSARLRARLLARVGAGRSAGATHVTRPALWTGWMVAAGLAGILLVHHSVHRTLDYGWLAAGILAIALVGLGVYARSQRRRASEMRERLAAQERRPEIGVNEVEVKKSK